jgi:hypothetical protein
MAAVHASQPNVNHLLTGNLPPWNTEVQKKHSEERKSR